MAIGALALGLVAAAPTSTAAQDKSLWDVVAMLQTKKFVDLTHAFDRNIPHWKGFDPPAHFVKGKRFVDDIDLKEMVLPLVVLEVHEKAAQNPDDLLTMDDVKAWEAR